MTISRNWNGGGGKRPRKQSNMHGTFDIKEIKTHIKNTAITMRTEQPIMINKLQQEIIQLKALKSNGYHGRTQIRQYFENNRLIKIKQRKLKDVRQGKAIQAFSERVRPLIAQSPPYTPKLITKSGATNYKSVLIDQQKHALFLNIFKPYKALPSFVNRDICQQCGTYLQTLTSEAKSICPNTRCGNTTHILDYHVDMIQQEDNKKPEYNKIPLFRRFVTQFSVDVPDPKQDHIDIMLDALVHEHILLPSRVKPTRVAKIMREAKLPQCASMPVRISRIINGEPPIRFSTDLINRLVIRFTKYTYAQKMIVTDTTKELPEIVKLSNEFLTKYFLMMEGEYKLSRHFHMQKTREVNIKAESWFNHCCVILQQSSDQMVWKYSRAC